MMKHTLRVTLLLVALFFFAHLIGLGILNGYLHKEQVVVEGEIVTNVTWEALPYDVQRPEFDEKTSFLPLILIILAATFAILLLMKLKLLRLWKFWFFMSVWFCLAVALKVMFADAIAVAIAALLSGAKVFWRNAVLHNLTELLIYGGLAVVFVPFLGLMSASILLVLISIYDMIAVWRTKHMVSMAQFQTKMKLFAGLLIPYGKERQAILGGGDIGFTLFFSGVVLKQFGLMQGILVSAVVSLALLWLLLKSQKNRYYPAMPFLSMGCFAGLLLVYLL